MRYGTGLGLKLVELVEHVARLDNGLLHVLAELFRHQTEALLFRSDGFIPDVPAHRTEQGQYPAQRGYRNPPKQFVATNHGLKIPVKNQSGRLGRVYITSLMRVSVLGGAR